MLRVKNHAEKGLMFFVFFEMSAFDVELKTAFLSKILRIVKVSPKVINISMLLTIFLKGKTCILN